MKINKIILIFLLSIIVTFIFMYLVILNINSRIPSFYSTDEPYGVIWSFWWSKLAYLSKIPANIINVIAYPFGIKVDVIAFFPLWGPIAKYIAIFFNEVIAYNTILLSTFILSVLTMYFLVFYLTRNTVISIFSSLIYSFCPFHFVRVWQHFGTAQIQWMPLYILFLFKLLDYLQLKFALLLGVSLALNYYFDVHYAYYMAIATALFFFLMFFSRSTKTDKFRFTKSLCSAIIVAVILILPALLPFLGKFMKSNNQVASAYSLVRPFEDLFVQSARPLSYFLPFTEQPVFGKLTQMFVGTNIWGTSLTEHNIFLGFIPMLLAIIAFLKRKSLVALMQQKGIDIRFSLKFFFYLVIVGWLFSQPPWWNIFGFKLYMPSFFMYKILPMFRAYVRFGIVVMLGVSVLAGFGLIYILNRFKSQKTKIAIVFLICFLSLYEFWNNPKEHIIDLSKYPKAYDWIKQQKEDFIIAEYPLDIAGPNEKYKFYQTKHQKSIINGTLPGTYANMIAQTITKLSLPRTASVLKWLGVKYVLVHINDYKDTGFTEDVEEIKNMSKNVGLEPVTKFDGIDIYEVVAKPLEPSVKIIK